MKNKALQENLLSLTPHVWLITGFIIGLLMSFITLLYTVILYRQFIQEIRVCSKISMQQRQTRNYSNRKRTITISLWKWMVYLCRIVASLSIALVGFLYTASVLDLVVTAYQHGMIELNRPIKAIQKSVRNSPMQSKLPKDINNCLIIYYKFGCSDCETVYSILQNALQDTPVYWISVQSATGKKLLNQYPVSEVPSGLYITHQHTGITKSLSKTINHHTVVDVDHLNDLLNLKANP